MTVDVMKSKKIKAVIFDMDGVIVDSEPIESLSLEKLLRKYGKTPQYNKEGLIHTVGLAGETYKQVSKKYNLKEDIEVLKKIKRKIFRDLVEKKLTVIPGFIDLVRMLKEEKMKIALASNRFVDLVFFMLNKIKAKDLFDVIVGASDEIKPKPSPDIYLQVARELKIKPADCVALEDAETGIVAAKKAGMKVIAIPNKYTKSHNFAKADKIVKSLSQITLPLIHSL